MGQLRTAQFHLRLSAGEINLIQKQAAADEPAGQGGAAEQGHGKSRCESTHYWNLLCVYCYLV